MPIGARGADYIINSKGKKEYVDQGIPPVYHRHSPGSSSIYNTGSTRHTPPTTHVPTHYSKDKLDKLTSKKSWVELTYKDSPARQEEVNRIDSQIEKEKAKMSKHEGEHFSKHSFPTHGMGKHPHYEMNMRHDYSDGHPHHGPNPHEHSMKGHHTVHGPHHMSHHMGHHGAMHGDGMAGYHHAMHGDYMKGRNRHHGMVSHGGGMKMGAHAPAPMKHPMVSHGDTSSYESGDEGGESDMHGAGGKNWIQGAIKNKGALHKSMGVPEGHKIPAKKLHKAAEAGGTLGKRARLAETLKNMNK